MCDSSNHEKFAKSMKSDAGASADASSNADRANRDSAPSNQPDFEKFGAAMGRIAERSQSIMRILAERQAEDPDDFNPLPPPAVSKIGQELWQRMLSDPKRLADAQVSFWQDYARLWEHAARRFAGQQSDPIEKPEPGDRRFSDAAWSENPFYDQIKQGYLLISRHFLSAVRETQGLDAQTSRKAEFFTRQFIDALSPTNFAMTNPQVVQRTIESGGENLLQGLENVLEDLESGQGKLRIRMTDTEKFRLGGNIAVTPGKVVFENELMQLIQYAPTTPQVRKRPLLIIPPWINKFYILDLRPKNSFVRWAVEQGHTVFVISWINPDESLADKTLADYVRSGSLAAISAVRQATGEERVNAIGYCIGGTLLSMTLAWLAARDERLIESATFFTTMVDFSEPGDLGVFVDDDQLAQVEAAMDRKGYFEGSDMAEAFNLLRANDLIWNFVINNYLMGKDPLPFDLLYWNSDSTRMPRAMHTEYLRNMYRNDLLCRPGGIVIDGVPIDLGKIDIPVYILSAREDHIAPWTSTFAATRLYQGPVRFVLAKSGHIAGVINPPAANKYGHYTGELTETCEQWLEAARSHDGSWWPDWDDWILQFTDGVCDARVPGEGPLAAIEDAPGRYVKVRAD